jgi:hypothetical protein
MSKPVPKSEHEPPWSVPVALSTVPEAGRHFDLVADAQARSAIAELAAVAALPRLVASFDVTRHRRGGLHVVGRVLATVDQLCVVTLEPVANEIDEPVDLVFIPAAESSLTGHGDLEGAAEDGPEILVGGVVDLGGIATEFLILGIDPYPRKSDAVFQAPSTEQDDPAGPFAALSALKGEKAKE